MLPRKNLVPLKSEFSRIKATGKLYDSPCFGLLVNFNKLSEEKNLLGPQCAFIVSKKVDNRSVVRHQVKRRLAEAVAGYLPRISRTAELVFLAKGKSVTTSDEEVKKDMEAVLKRAHLL